YRRRCGGRTASPTGSNAQERHRGKAAILPVSFPSLLFFPFWRSGEKSMSRFLGFVCGALLATSPVLAQSAPKLGKWGVDLSSMDTAVKAGDNFFLYVNGKWLASAAIPPDRSQTGSFQDLQILSEQRLKTIVDDLQKAQDRRLTQEERKLRDLHDAFVDTAAIEARGLAPVQKDLDYLAGLKTLDDVAHAMG